MQENDGEAESSELFPRVAPSGKTREIAGRLALHISLLAPPPMEKQIKRACAIVSLTPSLSESTEGIILGDLGLLVVAVKYSRD